MPTHRPSTLLALCLTCVLPTAALAQTLARPGWAGSGLTAEPWWKHAVLYQVDPAGFNAVDLNKAESTELQGVTKRLDYLQSLGVDALLLTPDALLLTPIQSAAANVQSVDPSHGTVDDLDDLIHQASSHNIRVLLTLSSSTPTKDLTAAARYWLNHGIAGFHLTAVSGTAAADAYNTQLAELRKVTSSYVGHRIVVGDLNQSGAAAAPQTKAPQSHDRSAAQLLLDPRAATASQFTAASLRPAIEASQDLLQTGAMPVLLSDGPQYPRSISRYGDGTHDAAIAKALATVLLTSHAGSLIYYGQELSAAAPASPDAAAIHWDAPPAPAKGKPTAAPSTQTTAPSTYTATPNVALEDADKASLLNWYRQLSVLHHGNATITSGAQITINHDDQNVLVWIRKPQVVSKITPPIVVICNLSAQPVHLALKDDIKRLHLRGSFLRTVLRTDTGTGPMHLESMTISPFGVYIGELRF